MAKTLRTEIALIWQSLKRTKEDIKELVTQTEFDPIKKIVYGLVGLVLSSVFIALIALVVKK